MPATALLHQRRTHQPQYLWAQIQILLWGNLSFWGGSQTQILLWGLFPILGAHWGLLGFRGSKSNFTLGHFSFWGVSQTQILLRGFCPCWGSTGAFWGSGAQNQILFRGLLPIVRVPNSNLTLGLLPIFGPQTQILLRGLLPILRAHCGLLGFRRPKSNFISGFYPSLGSRTLI
jgi:hypothetical protein